MELAHTYSFATSFFPFSGILLFPFDQICFQSDGLGAGVLQGPSESALLQCPRFTSSPVILKSVPPHLDNYDHTEHDKSVAQAGSATQMSARLVIFIIYLKNFAQYS